MQEEVRVVLDAMGGDHAPEEMIKGAVEAVNEKITSMFFLVGQEDVISEELEKYTYPKERMEIVHASEVIETAEPPVMAIRKKKDSSIVVGMNMVKNGEADAFCVSRKFRSHSCRWTGYRRAGSRELKDRR